VTFPLTSSLSIFFSRAQYPSLKYWLLLLAFLFFDVCEAKAFLLCAFNREKDGTLHIYSHHIFSCRRRGIITYIRTGKIASSWLKPFQRMTSEMESAWVTGLGKDSVVPGHKTLHRPYGISREDMILTLLMERVVFSYCHSNRQSSVAVTIVDVLI